MSIDGEEKPWMCGAGAVNLRRVGSIVRDIGEPCLQHSPTKGRKMLKPGRWHAAFDSDGKGFFVGENCSGQFRYVAADFDESTSHELTNNCLDQLILHLAQDAATCTTDGNNKQHSKNSPTTHSNAGEPVSGVDAMWPVSMIPFCGFKPSNFWTRNHHWQTNTLTFSPLRNGGDDLVVFLSGSDLDSQPSKNH